MKKLGSIETGGTKIICAIGYKNGEILREIIIPTTTPDKNIVEIVEFFKDEGILALGIGSFGPIDTKKNSPEYGKILNTPKLSWVNFNLFRVLKRGLPGIPMELVTDVGEADIGEYKLGAGKGFSSLLYITVGTGIGAGYITEERLLEGFSSPEMGHILVEKLPEDDYLGCCPYHGDSCLEGLASGTAIEDRWGKKGIDLEDNKKVWEMEAKYLAKALANYIYILAPEIIVMGGGIMKQKSLIPLIKENLAEIINDYIGLNKVKIVTPKLKDRSGIIGGFVLANRLL